MALIVSLWFRAVSHGKLSQGVSIPKKILDFGSSFYIMELNIMQIFWQKSGYSLYFGLNPKSPQEAFTRAINSAFWIELNSYFALHHFKVVGILYFTFFLLNTPLIVGAPQ